MHNYVVEPTTTFTALVRGLAECRQRADLYGTLTSRPFERRAYLASDARRVRVLRDARLSLRMIEWRLDNISLPMLQHSDDDDLRVQRWPIKQDKTQASNSGFFHSWLVKLS